MLLDEYVLTNFSHIVLHVLSYLPTEDLKVCRQVHPLWERLAIRLLAKRTRKLKRIVHPRVFKYYLYGAVGRCEGCDDEFTDKRSFCFPEFRMTAKPTVYPDWYGFLRQIPDNLINPPIEHATLHFPSDAVRSFHFWRFWDPFFRPLVANHTYVANKFEQSGIKDIQGIIWFGSYSLEWRWDLQFVPPLGTSFLAMVPFGVPPAYPLADKCLTAIVFHGKNVEIKLATFHTRRLHWRHDLPQLRKKIQDVSHDLRGLVDLSVLVFLNFAFDSSDAAVERYFNRISELLQELLGKINVVFFCTDFLFNFPLSLPGPLDDDSQWTNHQRLLFRQASGEQIKLINLYFVNFLN